jgi:hypothetical protein
MRSITFALLALFACASCGGDHDALGDPRPQNISRAVCQRPVLTDGGAICRNDPECRTAAANCGGCACAALGHDDPDPACRGPRTSCFSDPCLNVVAVRENGACVLKACCFGGSGDELQ